MALRKQFTSMPPDNDTLAQLKSKRLAPIVKTVRFNQRQKDELDLFNFPEDTIYACQQTRSCLPESNILIKHHSPFLNPDLLTTQEERRRTRRLFERMTSQEQLEYYQQQSPEEQQQLLIAQQQSARRSPREDASDEFDLGDDFASLAFKKKIQRKNQIKERKNLHDMKVQFNSL